MNSHLMKVTLCRKTEHIFKCVLSNIFHNVNETHSIHGVQEIMKLFIYFCHLNSNIVRR